MTVVKIALCLGVLVLAGGCGGNRTCDKPEPYQAAYEGRRIAVPDGLDELQASRELKVPDASPQELRAEGSPCLDLPPVYRSSGK